jgi:hypothetical protein
MPPATRPARLAKPPKRAKRLVGTLLLFAVVMMRPKMKCYQCSNIRTDAAQSPTILSSPPKITSAIKKIKNSCHIQQRHRVLVLNPAQCSSKLRGYFNVQSTICEMFNAHTDTLGDVCRVHDEFFKRYEGGRTFRRDQF